MSIHYVESYDKGTERLIVEDTKATIHHYRFDYHMKRDYEEVVGKNHGTAAATVRDASLEHFVPKLEKALQDRFRLKNKKQLKAFLRYMSAKRPEEAGKAASKYDPWR